MQKGSVLLWVFGILILVALSAVAFLIWGKTFLLTEGLDNSQINTYTNAIDSANKIQGKVNQSNKSAIDKLNQIQKNYPTSN